MVVISIAQGKLKGGETKTDDGVTYYEFLGVPYAKPPIGKLRFRVSKYTVFVYFRSSSKCFEYM